MRRKLAGFFLVTFISFCFFTLLLHSMAHLQPKLFLAATLPTPTLQTLSIREPQPTATPTSTPIPTLTPTPFPTQTPFPTVTPTPIPTLAVAVDLESLFTKYSDEYHADKELLKRIARCESGFNANAENGPYLGMFQFTEQTWISARSAMGMDPNQELRRNAEEAIRTAAYKVGNGQANAWSGCL